MVITRNKSTRNHEKNKQDAEYTSYLQFQIELEQPPRLQGVNSESPLRTTPKRPAR